MIEPILHHLSPAYPWADRFHCYESIDSTNDEAKRRALSGAPHGTVILAEHQTRGHGRMGRSFHSPRSQGVYLSLLLRPNCHPAELMHLTCAAAVAACDAAEITAGFRPGIKWTNDLVSGRKKLGGILTGVGLSSSGKIDYAIIGIGINCNQKEDDFPSDIQNMATSLSISAGHEIDRYSFAAALMESLYRMDNHLIAGKTEILRRYRRDCITLGQEIQLVRGEEKRFGKAIEIDENGALIVSFADGKTETVNSGEVSVRGMYGYL